MIFLFKQKPIHLDCFTTAPAIYRDAFIQPASKFLPDWWKQTPKAYEAQGVMLPTMRTCAGILSLYSKGVIIPMWCDLGIKVEGTTSFQWYLADEEQRLTPHDMRQMGSLLKDTNTAHMKLETPWLFKCKEEIYWHYFQPVWNQQLANDFCIPSGIVEYKYQHSSAANILVRLHGDKMFVIPYQEPLAHIVPLSDRPIKIHNHLIEQRELEKIDVRRRSFLNGYAKSKKWQQSQESKCPFGFKRKK